jgi:hypothetical protein
MFLRFISRYNQIYFKSSRYKKIEKKSVEAKNSGIGHGGKTSSGVKIGCAFKVI